MKKWFNSLILNYFYSEQCTCSENDGCFICSENFSLLEYATRHIRQYIEIDIIH